MPLSREGRGTGWALAVDIVNTWDEYPHPMDLIDGPADVRTVLDWHGLHEAARMVEPRDAARLRRLRTRLERVFDAAGEDEAVRLLNELLAEHGTPPSLERAGDGWHLRAWPAESEGLRTAAALAAFGLLETIRDLGWARLGRCAGAPCRCAYVDRTRNRSRRFCSTLCADRVAQANARRRRAAAPRRTRNSEALQRQSR